MTQDTTRSWLLDYLPAIFHQDDGASGQQGSYLGQFLKPFDLVLAGFEELLAVLDSYFSPDTAPEEWAPWLGQWLALDLDENWEFERRRELLGKAMELHRRRGTIAGLKQFVEIYNPKLSAAVVEGRRRSGMRIGVASRIGDFSRADSSQAEPPDLDAIVSIERRKLSDSTFGLVVFDTVATADHPFFGERVKSRQLQEGEQAQLVISTTQVRRMTVEGDPGGYLVTIQLKDRPLQFKASAVARVDGFADDVYRFTTGITPKAESVHDFGGDTFLIDEEEAPYTFLIDLAVPEADWTDVTRPQSLRAISGIVEEIKPAHTTYGLTLAKKPDAPRIYTMQIGVKSRIGDEAKAIG